jgi:hypothetical protein
MEMGIIWQFSWRNQVWQDRDYRSKPGQSLKKKSSAGAWKWKWEHKLAPENYFSSPEKIF